MALSFEKFTRNSLDQKVNNNAAVPSSSSKEDSILKIEDESSLSDGGYTFMSKTMNAGHFNFENVRFTPKVIEFIDAFEGKQFAVKITIQNVGTEPVLVKIGEPNSFIFQLKKPSRRTKFLAAGACIRKTITYTFHNVDLVQKSQIPIEINGHVVDYPIVVKKATPEIEIYPQTLDFKIINLGASAKTMVLTIQNKGGKRTKFKIDVGKNLLDLVVNPMAGTIKAKSQVKVLVEMMGFNEGEFYHELWIKTNEMPIRVPVIVKVVRPRLEILYPNGTEDFTLITFKPTFNGTQKVQSFVLYNCSTDTALFSTLAEVNGELQILENARSSTAAFNMFLLTAEEGRLDPFEKRIISVLFRPKPIVTKKNWQQKQSEKKKKQWEHIVFLRINRVNRIEEKDLENKPEQRRQTIPALKSISVLSGAEIGKNSSTYEFSPELEELPSGRRNYFKESSIPEEKVLRLCLYGNSVEPDVLIQPTSFEFGELQLGQTGTKVLRITNQTTIPMKCKFCKTVNVKTTPEEVWLKKESAQEFVVAVTPKCAGMFKRKMKFQIFAQSDVVLDSDKALETVAVYTVTINYNAKNVFKSPGPKVGQGITPLITDEVGFHKDLITFKNLNACPPVAMLDVKQGWKTKWMRNEVNKLENVDNALVALPNDRPRLFYKWPKDKLCRTIFTGLFRYSPPKDLSYTLSSDKWKQKKVHNEIWKSYLTFLRMFREANSPSEEQVQRCLEYEISRNDHYNLTHIKPSSALDFPAFTSKALRKCSKEPDDTPEYTFVPLSPMLLSNVTVHPKIMNFDKVAVNTEGQKAVSIKNMNTFPISIKFVSGKSAVSVMEQDTITIQPSVTKYIQVSFYSKDLGRYFGFLNYVINGSHEFKITISAFVIPKTIYLGDSSTPLHFGLYDAREAFQPRSLFLPMENPLQAPIKYRWNMAPESAFAINIPDGEIAARSTLFAEILFNMCPGKSFYSEMTLVSESGVTETVKLIHASKKVSVNFLSSKVDMHDIPLNLPTKVKAIIQNASYHDVTFEVLDAGPLPGITIHPKQGLLKARSFFPLEIKAQIPVIMKFNFVVVLMVHFVNKISVKVTGNVVPPNIRMKPSELVLRKICAQSIDTFTVCVENLGTTPAEVVLDFKNCPEYSMVDNKSKMYLAPKQSSRFLIQMEPTDVARYMFYLPVTINKILGPPEMQEPETEYVHFYLSKFESLYEHLGDVVDSRSSSLKIPCVCLNSTVSQSLLSISPLKVNFKLENKFYLKFQPQKIVFSNDFDSDVTFCIRTDDLGESNDSPFDLFPVKPDSMEKRLKSFKGHLNQGEQLTMKATFAPKKPGNYNVDVPVFVRGYSNGLVYNYIRLKGELKPSRIDPEVSEVHFPPLPLDVGCDVTVLVCAENYRFRDTIKCLIYDSREENGESVNQYLKTDWLTEPNVSDCQKAEGFHLRISFQSPVPVAMRNYILLFDSMGAYSTILVTAIADNSTVTTHAFLSTRTTKYKIVREKLPNHKEEDFSFRPSSKYEFRITDKYLKNKPAGSRVTVGISEESSEPNIVTETPWNPDRAPPKNGNKISTNNACSLQIDKGPRLIIQESKSISKSNALGFVNPIRHLVDCSNSSSNLFPGTKNKLLNSLSKSESFSGSKTFLNMPLGKRADFTGDVSYPNFPVQEGLYKRHFQETLVYVERWIFEVVMRCDQYFVIPESFQNITEPQKTDEGGRKSKVVETRLEKDFLDFLKEIIGEKLQFQTISGFPGEEVLSPPQIKANKMRSMYAEVLRFLESRGCLLPHVKPEYLLDYENYVLCTTNSKFVDSFSWKKIELEKMNSLKIVQDNPVRNKSEREAVLNKSSSFFSSRDSWKKSLFDDYIQTSDIELEKLEDKNSDSAEYSFHHKTKLEPLKDLVIGKQFTHETEVLDQFNFDLRATQAWLDVLIQIFRVFCLRSVTLKNTIPHVSMIEMNDKISVQTVFCHNCRQVKRLDSTQTDSFDDSNASNIFTVQERILMDWLNQHCQNQERILWGNSPENESPTGSKLINNFDKDLSDSIALIAVTAAHCPYLVSHYFSDIFPKADTINKAYHNAAKLILAWRALEIGLTVETSDIVQANPVFMVILVTQLYEVLPSLHPHSVIFFSSPLNTEVTRAIQLKNESEDRIVYKAKFFGETEGFFNLGTSSLIELKPVTVTDVKIVFTARKINKASATLVLSGCCVSPNFAKHMAFYLEGEPSELPENDKFCLSAPLYKVICTKIPVKPPYPDPETYEVWYTTKKPEYSDLREISTVIKPWSKIWNRKVSRRLFLNKSEVTIVEGQDSTLGVTVACLTEQTRLFWLLFRSRICDFILLIEIKPTTADNLITVTSSYPETLTPSATCLCSNKQKLSMPNSSSCPFLIELSIPTRNDNLWNALWTMFSKTLQPHEKSFWKEHFEMDIGICLIMWLLSPDEEEEVIDEFIQVLSTEVTYNLKVEPTSNALIPASITVLDVRKESKTVLPLHFTKFPPSTLTLKLTMTSENGKETRNLEIRLSQPDQLQKEQSFL